MSLTNELKNLIDADQLVTVRWFAATLKLSIEESKRVFEEFKANCGPNVAATYCISGFIDDSNYVVSVVPELSLEEKKASFRDIDSINVYSLQKSTLHSASIYNQLQASDNQLVNEQLANESSSSSFIMNTMGAIKLDGVIVKPVGQRLVQPSLKASSAASESSNKAASAATAGKASAAALSAPASKAPVASIANNFFSKVSGKPTSAKPTNTNSASKPTAAPVANAAASKPTEAPTVASSTVSSAPQSSGAKEMVDDEEDGEWDDGAGYKPNKENLKNRLPANSIPQDIEEGAKNSMSLEKQAAAEECADQEEGQDDADSAGKKHSKKATAVVRGAMDDYFEDVAIEKFKADQVADAAPEKKKKRKLVEKVTYLSIIFREIVYALCTTSKLGAIYTLSRLYCVSL
jgi:hypothetical protein